MSLPTQGSTSVPEDPLEQSCSALRSMSPTRLEQLERLGCRTIRDLLFHFPRQYVDLSELRRIDDLQPGQTQMAQGEIVEMGSRETGSGKPIVSIVLHDGSKRVLEGV